MVNDTRKKLMNKMCVVYEIVRTYYFQGIRICNFGCEILVSDISLYVCMSMSVHKYWCTQRYCKKNNGNALHIFIQQQR
jgi:hypothetical protein